MLVHQNVSLHQIQNALMVGPNILAYHPPCPSSNTSLFSKYVFALVFKQSMLDIDPHKDIWPKSYMYEVSIDKRFKRLHVPASNINKDNYGIYRNDILHQKLHKIEYKIIDYQQLKIIGKNAIINFGEATAAYFAFMKKNNYRAINPKIGTRASLGKGWLERDIAALLIWFYVVHPSKNNKYIISSVSCNNRIIGFLIGKNYKNDFVLSFAFLYILFLREINSDIDNITTYPYKALNVADWVVEQCNLINESLAYRTQDNMNIFEFIEQNKLIFKNNPSEINEVEYDRYIEALKTMMDTFLSVPLRLTNGIINKIETRIAHSLNDFALDILNLPITKLLCLIDSKNKIQNINYAVLHTNKNMLELRAEQYGGAVPVKIECESHKKSLFYITNYLMSNYISCKNLDDIHKNCIHYINSIARWHQDNEHADIYMLGI